MRRTVTVHIAGRDYRVVTDADARWLEGVAGRVDEAMALVRERTETVDSLDVAVLTALNLARELMYAREVGELPETASALGPGDEAEDLVGGPLVGSDVHSIEAGRLRELILAAESAIHAEP